VSSGDHIVPDAVLFIGGDTASSRAFYAAAMNRARESDDSGRTISFVPADGIPAPLAGCWVPCFTTADRVAASSRALNVGIVQVGDVLVSGQRVAIFAAPDGALFGLADAGSYRPLARLVGDIAFVDLYTPRAEEVAPRYARVLSCRVIDEPIAGPGNYRLLALDGRPVAGLVDMFDVLASVVPAHWIPLLRVLDLEREVARLSDLGASVRVPPTDSGLGPFAVLVDPFGVAFGLQTPVTDDLLLQHAKALVE
jgi:predicted enzyme related to lactoylglutathione lyase